MKIIQFEDLECWKESRKLMKMVYGLTKQSSFYKDYRLKDQIIGSGISIMNNIAEGFDAQSNNEFIRFLRISRRSTSEVKTCLYVAMDQGYIETNEFNEVVKHLESSRKLIDGMLRYLRKDKKEKNGILAIGN